MALVVQVQINTDPIAFLVVTRIKGDTQPDSNNTYSFEFIDIRDEKPVVMSAGTVHHRYGDGGWTLVTKCLEVGGMVEGLTLIPKWAMVEDAEWRCVPLDALNKIESLAEQSASQSRDYGRGFSDAIRQVQQLLALNMKEEREHQDGE